MTWLRWDVETPHADVVGDLAEALDISEAQALGHYFACCSGFGAHRKDGQVNAINDTTLERWALWTGKRGRFATAFRVRCTGEDGAVRGWGRQRAVIRKQTTDASRPPSHLRGSPELPAREVGGNPRGNMEGDGGRRTEDGYGDELLRPTDPRARLLARLAEEPGRHVVIDFLERMPADQKLASWEATLLGCLDGLGTAQGRVATVGELAAACTDYLASAPEKWGLLHFRSFVDRVVAKRFRPERGKPTPTDSPAEVAARWAGQAVDP